LYESVVGPTGDDDLYDVTTSTDIGLFGNSGGNFNAVFGLATDNAGVTYAVDGTTIYSVNLSNAVLTPVLDYGSNPEGLGSAQGTAFVFENSPPSTVPEPSTWAMILIGFAGMGYVARNRARSGLRCA
jgi:hypothetical protein